MCRWFARPLSPPFFIGIADPFDPLLMVLVVGGLVSCERKFLVKSAAFVAAPAVSAAKVGAQLF